MDIPWYHEGLRFRCTQCGNCCTGAPGFVWVNDEELAAIAQFRGETTAELTDRYARQIGDRVSLQEKHNGDCIFFEHGQGCTIYPVRPRQCRTWPFWKTNVRTPATWADTCRICPGSGQGDLISAEEITRRVKVIKL